jgi:hypothetical protein
VDWAAIAPLDKASRVARAKAVVFTVILRSGGGKFRTCTVENLTLRKVEFKENCTCTTFSLRYGKQALWKRASKCEGPERLPSDYVAVRSLSYRLSRWPARRSTAQWVLT